MLATYKDFRLFDFFPLNFDILSQTRINVIYEESASTHNIIHCDSIKKQDS